MDRANTISEIIKAYDNFIVRLYSRIRFSILHQRFMREIGQYLPDQGTVLDIGCGFGLFALNFAGEKKRLHIKGFDLNAKRIAMAQRAARHLGRTNVSFEVGDAGKAELKEPIDGAYMLDIIHHLPKEAVRRLLQQILDCLRDDRETVLIIKEINQYPAYKRWFTWWLDKLMDFRSPVHYWRREALQGLLVDLGFTVRTHEMVDYLPYPHILYICTKKPTGGGNPQ